MSLATTARDQDPDEPRQYALLLGVSDFERIELSGLPGRFTDSDVSDIGGALEKAGYRVSSMLGRSARRSDVVRQLSAHALRLRPTDTLLIYFTGPLLRSQHNGVVYALLADSSLDGLETEAIRLEHLLEFVAEIPARRKLVLLDLSLAGDLVYQAPSPAVVRHNLKLDSLLPPDFAVSPGSRGSVGQTTIAVERVETSTISGSIFASSVREALTTDAADGNRDYRLSLAELSRYVEQRFRQLAAGTGPLLTKAQDATDDWIVASLLRPATAARADLDLYRYRLLNWEDKAFISFETRLEAEVLLNAWWRSEQRVGPPLSPADAALVQTLRKHLEFKGSDDVVASSFERELQKARVAR